jgi:hypothetical protein
MACNIYKQLYSTKSGMGGEWRGLALAQWGQEERLGAGVADDATDSAGTGSTSVGVVL